MGTACSTVVVPIINQDQSYQRPQTTMRSILHVIIPLFLSQIHSIRCQDQISTPSKGTEQLPDDYADAIDRLETDIGSNSAKISRDPKKLHKRDGNFDELKQFQSQIDERQLKRKMAKSRIKGISDLSHGEISQMTDEELRQIHYSYQYELRAELDEMYQKVSDALAKDDLSEEERMKRTQRKMMLEKKKMMMKERNDALAETVSVYCCVLCTI